jgi:molybdate transport system permease protein
MSVAIYDHVEAGEFADANRLAAVMLVFSLAVLVALYAFARPKGRTR